MTEFNRASTIQYRQVESYEGYDDQFRAAVTHELLRLRTTWDPARIQAEVSYPAALMIDGYKVSTAVILYNVLPE